MNTLLFWFNSVLKVVCQWFFPWTKCWYSVMRKISNALRQGASTIKCCGDFSGHSLSFSPRPSPFNGCLLPVGLFLYSMAVRELKQQRFWATDVNRKRTWRYKFVSVKVYEREKASLPVEVHRSKTSLRKLPNDSLPRACYGLRWQNFPELSWTPQQGLFRKRWTTCILSRWVPRVININFLLRLSIRNQE